MLSYQTKSVTTFGSNWFMDQLGTYYAAEDVLDFDKKCLKQNTILIILSPMTLKSVFPNILPPKMFLRLGAPPVIIISMAQKILEGDQQD